MMATLLASIDAVGKIGTPAASGEPGVGPAVLLSLSNTSDAAQAALEALSNAVAAN
jgi:hypothetical protein